MRPETAATHIYRHTINYPVEEQLLDDYVNPDSSVLDVGTSATGRSALAAKARGASVTSIEINHEAIVEFASGHIGHDLALATSDMLRLPFADASFDVVQVSLHGMDYLLTPADRAAALREAERVLRPGGSLYFNSFNPLGLLFSPSGLRSEGMLAVRLKYLLSGRFLRSTLIDFNGLELHQASVLAVTREVEGCTDLRRASVRNLSGSNHNRFVVGLLSTAPYFVFAKPT